MLNIMIHTHPSIDVSTNTHITCTKQIAYMSSHGETLLLYNNDCYFYCLIPCCCWCCNLMEVRGNNPQSSMCAAPLNLGVVTPTHPLNRVHKPFERLPLLVGSNQ